MRFVIKINFQPSFKLQSTVVITYTEQPWRSQASPRAMKVHDDGPCALDDRASVLTKQALQNVNKHEHLGCKEACCAKGLLSPLHTALL